MKNFLKFVLVSVLGLMQSAWAALLPDENELSSNLRRDGKADGPVFIPGGLLSGLEGMKDEGPSAAAIKAASKELFEKMERVTSTLKDELNTIVGSKIDALQREKIDRINDAIDAVRSGLKDNNRKLDEFEKNYAQKLAAISQAPQTVMGVKDLQQVARERAMELTTSWMRNNRLDQGVKDELDKTYDRLAQAGVKGIEAKKATTFLIANNTFLIPAEIDSQIMEMVSTESGILSAVATVVSTTKDYRKLINRRGTQLSSVAESDTRSATNAPTMSEVTLYYGELYANYEVAVHALDDAAFDVESEFLQSTKIDMAESIDTDVITGNGLKTAKGLNAYPYVDTLTWGSILRVQSGGAVDYEFILDIIHALRKNYRRNAGWLIGNQGLRAFRGVQDGNSSYVFWPSFNEGRYDESILGYPIFETDDLDAPTVDGARLCYFGDFRRAYIVHFLRGMRMVRDEVTNKGFVSFYLSQRWGGGLADSNAIVMGQKTASAS